MLPQQLCKWAWEGEREKRWRRKKEGRKKERDNERDREQTSRLADLARVAGLLDSLTVYDLSSMA